MIIRPRSDYYDDFAESHTFVAGSSDTALHPWEWDDATTDAMVAEHNAKMAKKRPVGFAPWPKEPS